MNTLTELTVEMLRHEDLDRVLMLTDEATLPDHMQLIIDERVEWRDAGLCDECGAMLMTHTNGHPGYTFTEYSCPHCDL